MHTKRIKSILNKHNLRHTKMREDILSLFMDHPVALQKNEIEARLPDADRVTVYRTLKSFEEQGVIHLAIDGTAAQRYALCEDKCDEHAHHDAHAHFHCDQCGQTFCLEGVSVPSIDVAGKHQVKSAHLALHGNCATCAEKE